MIKFFLNDKEVTAEENETIWQVAKKNGLTLPDFKLNCPNFSASFSIQCFINRFL